MLHVLPRLEVDLLVCIPRATQVTDTLQVKLLWVGVVGVMYTGRQTHQGGSLLRLLWRQPLSAVV
jgi:hypothetical protein